jgi:pyruvate,water dikinase
MVGISERAAQPKARLGALLRVVSLATAVAILARARSISRDFQRRFAPLQARHRDSGTTERTVEEIVATYTALESEVSAFWHLTLYIDLCAIRYHEWLASLGDRWGIDAALRNALLSGEEGVESVEPVVSLLTIAETVGREPAFRHLFAEADDAAVWRATLGDERYSQLRGAFDAHLQDFGDRGLEELKLEAPSFRDEPARLVALVRHYLRLNLTVSGLREEERGRRVAAEDALRRHPLGALQRALFAFVLGQARLAIRSRENMRFARSRLFGIVRRLFRRLGELFVTAGLLVESSDVFFLTLDEALGVVEGTAVTRDLEALVAIRKAEYATFERRAPCDRVETMGIPCLAGKTESAAEPTGGRTLRGTGCSPGRATGIAAVVTDPRRAVVNRNRVLVAKSTDPGWVFLMIASAGLVAERGSLLSHTAIIGRELGIPTVVGVRGATERIPDGAAIAIDGTTGEVTWL